MYRGSVEINQIIVNASGTSQSRSYISKALSDPPYHFELAEHSVSLTVRRGVYEQRGAWIESFSSARRYCRDRINDNGFVHSVWYLPNALMSLSSLAAEPARITIPNEPPRGERV